MGQAIRTIENIAGNNELPSGNFPEIVLRKRHVLTKITLGMGRRVENPARRIGKIETPVSRSAPVRILLKFYHCTKDM